MNMKYQCRQKKKQVLLIHYGFSNNAHFNRYELILRLLAKGFALKVDAIMCDGMQPICGFHELPLGTLPNDLIDFDSYIENKKCSKCKKRLSSTRLVNQFAVNLIPLSEYLSKRDEAEIADYLEDVKDLTNLNDFLELSFDGVTVGIDAWQSVQRNLKLGRFEDLNLTSENPVRGALYSALRLARFTKNLLEDKNYDLILTNETAYLDWGVPARVALDHAIPVLREGGSYFCGNNYRNLALYKSVKELERSPWYPNPGEAKEIVSDFSLHNLMLEISGRKELNKWMIPDEATGPQVSSSMDKTASRESIRALNTLISEKTSGSERLLVVIYCHLCWDAAVSFGDMLYDTFEDWLSATINSAVEADQVRWVFKIHPAELSGKVNAEFNTYTHVKKELARNGDPKHISILSEPIPPGLILPLVDIGVTALGTAAFELPSHGKPCLVASRGGYANLPFVRSVKNKKDYENALVNIHQIKPISVGEQTYAARFAGVMFDRERYLDARSLSSWVNGNASIINKLRVKFWASKVDLKFRSSDTDTELFDG